MSQLIRLSNSFSNSPSNTESRFLTNTKSRFLQLPGELRNIIYEYVGFELWLVDNPVGGTAPFVCLRHIAQTTEKKAFPHSLTSTCRQIRNEFSSVLRNYTSPPRWARSIYIENYEFGWFLKHLKALPPANNVNDIVFLINPKSDEYSSKYFDDLKELVISMIPRSPRHLDDPVVFIESRPCAVSFQINSASVHTRGLDACTMEMNKVIRRMTRWLTSIQGIHPGPPNTTSLRANTVKSYKLCRLNVAIREWRLSTSDVVATVESYILRRLEVAIQEWRLSTSDVAAAARLKYADRDKTKRYAESAYRQHKRRRLGYGNNWEIREGFDMYGDEIEEYEPLLSMLKEWDV